MQLLVTVCINFVVSVDPENMNGSWQSKELSLKMSGRADF